MDIAIESNIKYNGMCIYYMWNTVFDRKLKKIKLIKMLQNLLETKWINRRASDWEITFVLSKKGLEYFM